MTQHQRLLQAFQEKQDLMVYEIMAPRPQGLGIAQYNARIKELREMGHPIVNVEKGHFRYQRKEKAMKPKSVTNQTYKHFQQMGAYLKGQEAKPARVYEEQAYTELLTLKSTAEEWLKEHRNNKNYTEALRRYEAICDEITYREAQEELL